MIEYEAQASRKLQKLLVFSAWMELLAVRGLTTSGLRHVRAALESHLFSPGPDVELMKLTIDEALAESLGVPVEDLSEGPVPDGLSALDELWYTARNAPPTRLPR